MSVAYTGTISDDSEAHLSVRGVSGVLYGTWYTYGADYFPWSFYDDNTSRGIASSLWNDPPCDIIARPTSFFGNSPLATTFLPKRSVGISDNLMHLTNSALSSGLSLLYAKYLCTV